MKKCIHCNSLFTAKYPYLLRTKRYCTRKCHIASGNHHKNYVMSENTKKKISQTLKENQVGFTKGYIPWNKGVIGWRTHEQNPTWKGDNAGYQALHGWVRRYRNHTDCHMCGTDKKKLEWANISHMYKRELSDWMSLCRSCHVVYDKGRSDMKKHFAKGGISSAR